MKKCKYTLLNLRAGPQTSLRQPEETTNNSPDWSFTGCGLGPVKLCVAELVAGGQSHNPEFAKSSLRWTIWFKDPEYQGLQLGSISKNNYVLTDPRSRALHPPGLSCRWHQWAGPHTAPRHPAPFTPWANPRTLRMNGAPGVVQHAGPSCMYVEKHLRFLITLGKCPKKIWSEAETWYTDLWSSQRKARKKPGSYFRKMLPYSDT